MDVRTTETKRSLATSKGALTGLSSRCRRSKWLTSERRARRCPNPRGGVAKYACGFASMSGNIAIEAMSGRAELALHPNAVKRADLGLVDGEVLEDPVQTVPQGVGHAYPLLRPRGGRRRHLGSSVADSRGR